MNLNKPIEIGDFVLVPTYQCIYYGVSLYLLLALPTLGYHLSDVISLDRDWNWVRPTRATTNRVARNNLICPVHTFFHSIQLGHHHPKPQAIISTS